MKITMKLQALLLLGAFTFASTGQVIAKESTIVTTSPDGKSVAVLAVTDKLSISISYIGQEVLLPSPIGLNVNKNVQLGPAPVVRKVSQHEVNEEIIPVVAEKRSLIPDLYNETEILFKGNFGLRIRAYNDGIAYRFFTRFPGNMTVNDEKLELNLALSDSVYFGEEESFISHSERLYRHYAVKTISEKQFCSLPALIQKANGWKIAFTEADLLDYPGLYLCGNNNRLPALKGIFPKAILEKKTAGDRLYEIISRADYIAKTRGTRDFPWRVFAIAETDASLLANDIIYRLGSPLKLAETSWIKPGKVAWDWWNANNIYGVDFASGINTATYKYYIDFASCWGLEYVILDEGWTDPADLSEINKDMDMDGLFTYAKQKNVGLILWVTGRALEERFDASLDQFEKWGATGIKVDFLVRDDQEMVNFYERVASEGAKHHLLVDFHGSFKPTGLSRAYPNVLSREGVKGLENNKWSENITPSHDVTIPFIRMFAGAMDYTPGATRNATKEGFRQVWSLPMSQGTRCHQLAMYVVYESPLQMLADCPSDYLQEPEMMDFLAAVPTTWDETLPIEARVGNFIVMARKHGSEWYAAAMTDWTARDFNVNLLFLGEGNYKAIIYSDGKNAGKRATDFIMESSIVNRNDRLAFHMAPGGGWAVRFIREN